MEVLVSIWMYSTYDEFEVTATASSLNGNVYKEQWSIKSLVMLAYFEAAD